MSFNRHRQKAIALSFAIASFASGAARQEAHAEQYPTRPITIVAPWPAGGIVDVSARLIAQKLAERLGKPVIVENRPGGGSTIGATAVARAEPDGHTLLFSGSTAFAVNPALFKKLPYDPVKDFTPVAVVVEIPMVLVVHPELPVQSLADLITLARQRPGQLSYASAGPGSPQHLYAELLKRMTGIEMLHVPYRGGPQALADVTAGRIPVVFGDPASSLPLIREGKVRALAVSSPRRLTYAPDIPTVGEAGVPGFEAAAWVMLAAPANTRDEIVNKLHAEVKAIVATPELQEQLTRLGVTPIESARPEQLRGFVDAEIVRWKEVVDRAGIAGTQ
jgi:tripartite-type tricarboxylate transporter receptor subunit TctC